jgi:hypothetical protein
MIITVGGLCVVIRRESGVSGIPERSRFITGALEY